MKWFLFACVFFVAVFGIEIILEVAGIGQLLFLVDVWILLSIFAIPIAVIFVILCYCFFEIDWIISRMVSYIIVIAVFVVVYVIGLIGFIFFFDSDSLFVVVVVMFAVVAFFNPLRRWVQAFVDYCFNWIKYDAEWVMVGFIGFFRDEVDPNMVFFGWVGVVSETMRLVAVGVWVRGGI